MEVVHAQDGVEIIEQLRRREKLADHPADHRRAALSAAHDDAKAGPAGLVADRLRPDVVDEDGRPVMGRAGDGDLELARQMREFGVQRRPLPDQLAPGARIDDLVGRHAGQRVAGGVAHAVAGRLYGVHLDRREVGEDVRRVFEARPVELDVLSSGEVSVSAVILAGDVREGPQLGRRQQAVGDRDAKHGSMLLDVQAILQAQRAEFVFGEFAREKTPRLVPELGHAAIDERGVEVVIAVHAQPSHL